MFLNFLHYLLERIVRAEPAYENACSAAQHHVPPGDDREGITLPCAEQRFKRVAFLEEIVLLVIYERLVHVRVASVSYVRNGRKHPVHAERFDLQAEIRKGYHAEGHPVFHDPTQDIHIVG